MLIISFCYKSLQNFFYYSIIENTMARLGKLGWFLGLIFGTVFGVLFAPRKGKELRSRMKAERKKGNLGISPLQDDMKLLGQEIASLAKEIYESDLVQDIVLKGRKKVKDLSKDLIGEVADFHVTRIEEKFQEGKRAATKANKAFNAFKGKAKKSLKIGKQAFKQIKGVMRIKPNDKKGK